MSILGFIEHSELKILSDILNKVEGKTTINLHGTRHCPWTGEDYRMESVLVQIPNDKNTKW